MLISIQVSRIRLPGLCIELSYRLQLLTRIFAVKAQIPQFEACLVGEIGIDSAGASSGCDQWGRSARRPGERGRPWDFPQTHHDDGRGGMFW